MLLQHEKEALPVDREVRKYQQRLAQFEKLQAQKEKRKKAVEDKQERVKQKQKDMCNFRTSEAAWLNDIPEAPTFKPTMEQFADPIGYIRSIQHEAAQWGMCKIISPVVPAIPGAMVLNNCEGKRFTFTTRQQYVRDVPWQAFEEAKFYQGGKKYSVGEYEKLADEFSRKRFGTAAFLPARLVEAEYWREMSADNGTVVEYGNDVEGSAFCSHSEDPLSSTKWNLQVLPKDELSVLRLLKGDVPGVTSPMLYIGMLFATFAWHVEDHYLYSINYQHLGASKVWYGVPAKDADAFEKVSEEEVYANALQAETKNGATETELLNSVHSTLLGKTTMFSPKLLHDRGVKVCRAVQAPGEFVVTFPRSYHAGFSLGFNIGEAVNFAIGDWFPFGQNASKRYSRLSRLPVLPHEQLLCSEAVLLSEREAAPDCRSVNDSAAAAENTVKKCFMGLVRSQHRKRALMIERGAQTHYMPVFSSSFPCSVCREMCYLAAVVCEECEDPKCLTCALAEETCGGHATVLIRSDLPRLEELCRKFEQELVDGKELLSTLGTDGLSSLDLDLSDELQELRTFDWKDLPLPTPERDVDREALSVEEELETLLGPLKEVPTGATASTSEEERAAEESPAGRPGTPLQSVGADISQSKAVDEVAGSKPHQKCKLESDDGIAFRCGANGRVPCEPSVNGGSQVVESSVGKLENHSVKQEQESLNKVRGRSTSVRTPKPKPPTSVAPAPAPVIGKRKRAAALKLLSEFQKGTYEDYDGAEVDIKRDSEDLSADRFTETWSNVSAESPELKDEAAIRGKRKKPSPGGKQATVAGTRLAALIPGRTLNGNDNPLVCIDDSMVNVAGPGKPELLLRRRIYAPSEITSERYLVASEVVKGSGYQTTTSASNVVDRWFRDAAANAEKCGLPQPGLPSRAYCKGVNAPGGQGCYVISAQDVLLIGWVLQENLKERLRRFTIGVWPEDPDPLSRLETLMTQALGFTKDRQQQLARGALVGGGQQQAAIGGVEAYPSPNFSNSNGKPGVPRKVPGNARPQPQLSSAMQMNQAHNGAGQLPAVVGLTANGQPVSTEMIKRYIMQKQGQLGPQQLSNLLMVMQRLRAHEERQAYYAAVAEMQTTTNTMKKNRIPPPKRGAPSVPVPQRRRSSLGVRPPRGNADHSSLDDMDHEDHLHNGFSMDFGQAQPGHGMFAGPGTRQMQQRLASANGTHMDGYAMGPRRGMPGALRQLASAGAQLRDDGEDGFMDGSGMLKPEHAHALAAAQAAHMQPGDEFDYLNGQLGFMDAGQDWP